MDAFSFFPPRFCCRPHRCEHMESRIIELSFNTSHPGYRVIQYDLHLMTSSELPENCRFWEKRWIFIIANLDLQKKITTPVWKRNLFTLYETGFIGWRLKDSSLFFGSKEKKTAVEFQSDIDVHSSGVWMSYSYFSRMDRWFWKLQVFGCIVDFLKSTQNLNKAIMLDICTLWLVQKCPVRLRWGFGKPLQKVIHFYLFPNRFGSILLGRPIQVLIIQRWIWAELENFEAIFQYLPLNLVHLYHWQLHSPL